MKISELASRAYSLEITLDGVSVGKVGAFCYANANQLFGSLQSMYQGFQHLKKSTFYGIKFEEVVPGHFVGERRIPGYGLYQFRFSGEPVALDVKVAPKPPCHSGEVSCEGRCLGVNCPSIVTAPVAEAANGPVMDIAPGFKLSELGYGIVTVISRDNDVAHYALGEMHNTPILDIALWNCVLNQAKYPSDDCIVDPESLTFFQIRDTNQFSAVVPGFEFIFVRQGGISDYAVYNPEDFAPFKNPFEEVMFKDLGAGYLSVEDMRGAPGSSEGNEVWFNNLGAPSIFWEREAPRLYSNDLPEEWKFDHESHPFFYDPNSGQYVSERWPLRLYFKKSLSRTAEPAPKVPEAKPTLKETFISWLKNILG